MTSRSSWMVIIKYRVVSSGWFYSYWSYTVCFVYRSLHVCPPRPRPPNKFFLHRKNSGRKPPIPNLLLMSEFEAHLHTCSFLHPHLCLAGQPAASFSPILWRNARTFTYSGLFSKYNTGHCSGARKVSSGKATWFQGFWYVRTKVMSYTIFKPI